mgnify:CR=1 FL=1
MSLIRWSPLIEPFDDLDRFFGDFPALVSRQSGFVPSLDIYQNEHNVIVETPLAGLNPEDVKVSIENDVLTIEGKSEKKSEVDEKKYYRKEVRYGSFHRSVALPVSVASDKAKAEYEDGVLKITVPKEERAKAKSVQIEMKKK